MAFPESQGRLEGRQTLGIEEYDGLSGFGLPSTKPLGAAGRGGSGSVAGDLSMPTSSAGSITRRRREGRERSSGWGDGNGAREGGETRALPEPVRGLRAWAFSPPAGAEREVGGALPAPEAGRTAVLGTPEARDGPATDLAAVGLTIDPLTRGLGAALGEAPFDRGSARHPSSRAISLRGSTRRLLGSKE
jgi:hypothetical protein